MTSHSTVLALLESDPTLAAALAGLDQRSEAMIQRTMAWSAINSGSWEADGLKAMAAALEPALSALPGVVTRDRLDPSTRVAASGYKTSVDHGDALRVRVRPEAAMQVALTGHYDTVFAASHPFQVPRRREDGALHGPGVADMKGGICVMLEALAAFETLPYANRLGYEVLLSPDEEIGSPASAPLLAELGSRAHVGMTYEPALPTGAMVDARKGSGNFALILKGRAAHVGRAFAEGRNAIAAAARAAVALDALNGLREGVTFNVGAIDGGGPVNMVPAAGVVRFNVRSPDEAATAWALAQVEALAAAAADRDGLSAELTGGFTRPAKPLTPRLAKLAAWTGEAGAALGIDLTFGPSGGVCEGNNLAAAGCMTIDTLGPCGGALHTADEFALPESFAERAKLSLLMLAAFATGTWDARSLRP